MYLRKTFKGEFTMLRITHGPHIGRITSDSVRVWLRLEEAASLRIQYAQCSIFNGEMSEEALSNYFQENKKQDLEDIQKQDDFVITIDITGLEADTQYIYQVELSNDGENYVEQSFEERSFGYFRTFPRNGSIHEELVFAFGSCFHPYIKGGNVKRDRIFTGLDIQSNKEKGFRFLLLLGDQIYADYVPKNLIKKNSGNWKRCLPLIANFVPLFSYYFRFKEAADFEAYKYAYRLYWDSFPFRKALMSIPTFMTFDDHEFRNGWGLQSENNPGTRRGRKFVSRKEEALKAYDLYQHTLNPQTPHKQYWYRFNFGDIGFFVLDTRTERDKKGEKIILDIKQMEALKDWLSNGGYTLKFIISSVSIAHISFHPLIDRFFPADSGDHWAGFPNQREELLNYIFDNKIKGVHCLSGDAHVSNIAKITERDSEIEVFSFISSPFAQKSTRLHEYITHKDDLGRRFSLTPVFNCAGENFGVVRVTPQKSNNDNTDKDLKSEFQTPSYGISYELYDKFAEQFFQCPGKAMIALDVDRTLSPSRMLKKDSKPYPNAARVVKRLHEQFGVVYLTARPRILPHISLVRHWLRENDFPTAQVIMIMKLKYILPCRYYDYKCEMIKHLRDNQLHTPLIGIGDKKADAKAYTKNNMISLILSTDNGNLPNDDVHNVKLESEVSVWDQIEKIIFNQILQKGGDSEEGTTYHRVYSEIKRLGRLS
ncbi:MAG: alkaline phosphatase family protein [Candidatus Scalindua sp. AMX11]|nr:MAG: alkaline phosphatase family protein [Candidatus Scalindua sp.]RZV66649.1 MAG: alkaline phosphatase family protein [Candidatus Scalindua sp. SCAELEC01]TDE63626.1 MAG: alkaline phosphatase family protein [Candidatus Scalindua sp. AMX11]